ncbi:hypothetical protein [Paraburkholderia domus]|nr:hypothetical protein [Paraburkholderia domus]MBK5059625.1 hypothetical protein [Burkholderia sp. R-70199]
MNGVSDYGAPTVMQPQMDRKKGIEGDEEMSGNPVDASHLRIAKAGP